MKTCRIQTLYRRWLIILTVGLVGCDSNSTVWNNRSGQDGARGSGTNNGSVEGTFPGGTSENGTQNGNVSESEGGVPTASPGKLLGCDKLSMNGLNATTLFVSPSGNDAGDGSENNPFKTLSKAQATARGLVSAGLTKPLYVFLRGGTYFQNQTLAFSAADSGTEANPVIYRSYQCEVARIVGGTPIQGDWQVHSGKILRANVGPLRFNSLFVNDKRAIRARSPNTDQYAVAKGGSKSSFGFSSGQINGSWTNLRDVEVVFYNYWEGPRERVNSVSGPTVQLQGSAFREIGYSSPAQYYVENVLEGLDQPGEWYLDKTSGTLYYWPADGLDPKAAEIIAPVVKKLVDVNHASNVFFKYLVLSATDWDLPANGHEGFQAGASITSPHAISFTSSTKCGIEGSILKHFGAYAINIDGSQSIEIIGNEISDAGAGGVKVGPATGIHFNETSSSEKNITVSDNTIHDNNAVYPEAIGGVWVMLASNVTISHNHIFNTTYSAISVGWNWTTASTSAQNNIIEFNHIHDALLKMNDGAGIYMLGRQPGTELRNNVIHDVLQRKQATSSNIFGIYLDEGSCQMTIKNNIVYRNTYGHHQNATGANVLENNIYAGADVFLMVFYNDKGTSLKNNILYYTKKNLTIFGGAGWNNMEGSQNNVIFTPGGNAKQNMGGWPFDKNSLFQDPLFVDVAKDNYQLQAQSPAFGMGFQAIDTSSVGVRDPFKR